MGAARGLPVVLKNGAPDDIRRLVDAVPGLEVVLSHFAGCFGPEEEYEQRLRIAGEYPNVFIDAGALTYRQRYPFPGARERLRRALETVSADRIAWGSDYPRPPLVADASYKQQLEFVTTDCDFLTDTQREAILGGTAMRVYAWDE